MVSKIHSFTFQIHNFKKRPSSFQPQGPTLDLCLVNFTFQPLVYIMKQRHMRLGPEFNFVPWTIFGIRQDEWKEEKFHCLAISIVNCRKFIFKHPFLDLEGLVVFALGKDCLTNQYLDIWEIFWYLENQY